MELVTLKGLTRDPSTFNHFNVLFRLFSNGRNYHLHARSVSNRRYKYLDGRLLNRNKDRRECHCDGLQERELQIRNTMAQNPKQSQNLRSTKCRQLHLGKGGTQ
uniref:Uncharacterized protein n=1 Tax=Magallana gigas TaxID=29159 RepID=A0A8W8MHJ6_MAGGI